MSRASVQVLGNITRDPETRKTSADKSVVSFGMAVNDGWGENKHTSFFDVTGFGKRGEALAKFLKKGDEVFIYGTMRQSSWDDKDTGAKRSKVEVIMDGFEFTTGRKKSEPKAKPKEEEDYGDPLDEPDESLPF